MTLAATWMQLEIIIPSEVRKKNKCLYGITYIYNLKYNTNESILQNQN